MSTPATDPEPIPGFDAVSESRKWREATSRELFAMSRDDRMAYLAEAHARYVAAREKDIAKDKPCAVREEPPDK